MGAGAAARKVGARVLEDTFFKRAKAEGYLARSAFKLLEIQGAPREGGRKGGGGASRLGWAGRCWGCAQPQKAGVLGGGQDVACNVKLLLAPLYASPHPTTIPFPSTLQRSIR